MDSEVKKEKAYKVLYRCPKTQRLFSAVCWVRFTKFGIQYSEVAETFPKPGSKIFVFSHLQHAQRFIRNDGSDQEIWEVEATNPTTCYVLGDYVRLSDWDDQRFVTIWNRLLDNLENMDLLQHDPNYGASPYGTMVCDSVKLIKKIE